MTREEREKTLEKYLESQGVGFAGALAAIVVAILEKIEREEQEGKI
jgi:hypothetical protein